MGFFVFLLCVTLAMAADNTVHKLGSFSIDKSQISVSGISGMATQFHMAYSSFIKGMGSVDGVPYGCAEGHMGTALGRCMTFPEEIDVNKLVVHAKEMAQAGKIDPLKNLKASSVYILSGDNDAFVVPGVSSKMEKFYKTLDGTTRLKTVHLPGAQHSFPTENYGNPCSKLSVPYISNCNFSAAFDILNFIYGNLKKPTGSESLKGKLLHFNQSEFMPQPPKAKRMIFLSTLVKGVAYVTEVLCGMMVKMLTTGTKPVFKGLFFGATDVVGTLVANPKKAHESMDTTGLVYIPSQCFDSTIVCKIHVVFHGCGMQRSVIGDDFVQHAGYNEVGELNNIIMLYPQAKARVSNNPLGCWDWWGYTGKNYDTKDAFQMKTIKNMIDRLTGDYM